LDDAGKETDMRPTPYSVRKIERHPATGWVTFCKCYWDWSEQWTGVASIPSLD
jgi:hypothetical protein